MSLPDHWLTPFGHLVVVDLPVSAPLHPEEARLAASWGDRRKVTFAGGRHALRLALQAAKVRVDGGIGPNDRGAPVLPAGVCGSVTHKDTVAGALVCTDGDGRVGVDVEHDERRERRDIDRLIEQVLTRREQELLPSDNADRCRACFVRFSLKESLYKALDPWVRRYVSFTEVEVDVEGTQAVFRVPGFEAEGAIVDVGRPGVILTLARCRPLRPGR